MTKCLFKAVGVLSLIMLLLGPVDVLEISDPAQAGPPVFRMIFPLGEALVTRYIHSVQKTPVEDEYFLRSGRLAQWEERFVSHNAGLPVDAPANARFVSTREWMIIRGGDTALDELVYRVGTEDLGRNVIVFPGAREWPLYRFFPGRRLIFRVAERPLLFGLAGTRFP